LFAFCIALEGAFATSKDYVNITHIKDSFVATYVHTTPLKDYVIGVSVSTLDVQKTFHNVTLSYNEAWTDLCLDVMMGTPLPQIVAELLPATFMDLRVFYRVVPKEEPIVMCPALAMMCPDGTEVGYTAIDGECVMVCPNVSQPLGGLSWDQMETIQKSFENDYLTFAPYSDYIYGVSISTIALMNATHNVTLGPNEHFTDYCLSGLLKRHLSDSVKFPSVYKGARVFYSMGGDICVLPSGDTVGCDENITTGAFTSVVIVISCVFFCYLSNGRMPHEKTQVQASMPLEITRTACCYKLGAF